MIPTNINSLADRVSEIEKREKVLDQCILLHIDLRIKSLDELRMKDQAMTVLKGK